MACGNAATIHMNAPVGVDSKNMFPVLTQANQISRKHFDEDSRFAFLILASTIRMPSAAAAAQTSNGDIYFPKIAPEATTDREVGLYRLPGAMASGADNSGVATSMRCTNYSAVPERLHFWIMDDAGTILINTSTILAGRATSTYSTNATVSMTETSLTSPGFRNGSIILPPRRRTFTARVDPRRDDSCAHRRRGEPRPRQPATGIAGVTDGEPSGAHASSAPEGARSIARLA